MYPESLRDSGMAATEPAISWLQVHCNSYTTIEHTRYSCEDVYRKWKISSWPSVTRDSGSLRKKSFNKLLTTLTSCHLSLSAHNVTGSCTQQRHVSNTLMVTTLHALGNSQTFPRRRRLNINKLWATILCCVRSSSIESIATRHQKSAVAGIFQTQTRDSFV